MIKNGPNPRFLILKMLSAHKKISRQGEAIFELFVTNGYQWPMKQSMPLIHPRACQYVNGPGASLLLEDHKSFQHENALLSRPQSPCLE